MKTPEKHTDFNQKKSISFRKATIEDLELVKYWDTQQHVIDSDPDDAWNWEYELSRDPRWRKQWIAQLGNEPIGFLQIIDPYYEESQYWGEVEKGISAIDIWIGEACNLNKGYGSQMMRLAVQHCFEVINSSKILIDPLKSNTKAHRFYERLGFTFLEERSFNGTVCFVYELYGSLHKL